MTASPQSVSHRLKALGDRHQSSFIHLELGLGDPSVVIQEMEQPVFIVALVDSLRLDESHGVDYFGKVLLASVPDLFHLSVVCPFDAA